VSSSPKPHADAAHEVLDPVAAYDRLAPHYAQFSERRSAYLRSVEEQIGSRILPTAKSLLDIGAGDGTRALRIADTAGMSRVVLLEPSSQISGGEARGTERWSVRAEGLDVPKIAERFDVITCLWNVIGHIKGSDNRARALSTATQLLSSNGLLFVDVIHRYNVRSYGWVMTTARWLRDRLAPGKSTGDVVARWKTTTGEISTYGHVFTDREMQRLAGAAGLEIVERLVIDYETGETRTWSCLGNLLYVFRRTSRIDSSSEPQTS
jgi:2-polyprenyl-3-methyl-5-hydroxy-6-metoxy-1,4-benzoquinol methylase